jgi:hypothetical protein
MTNPTSSKFDDDDINDDELLAACDDITLKQPEPIVPTSNSIEKFRLTSFGFPFEPYQIQIDFMRGLYSTIQQSKHGIFESPTGTV